MMTLQVLISTMYQKDHSLLDKMNIQSDAVVVNQCDMNQVEKFDYHGHSILWISMKERGIGKSRNTGLLFSTADIVLFADDDMVYNDGYADEVISVFENYKKADIVCFNITLINSNKNIGGHRNNISNKRLHVFNSMRYGATLIGARRKSLMRERIFFSLLFGGGSEFGSGEDSLFIIDCLRAGLKIYSNTYFLGSVDDSTSSWYKGINDKFFIDRGSVYYSGFPRIYRMIFLYYALKMAKLEKKYSPAKIYRLFVQGRRKIIAYR